MAEPWPCILLETGGWQVQWGPETTDCVVFPAGHEREARMCAAGPLMRDAIIHTREHFPAKQRAWSTSAAIVRPLERALAACEPIRERQSHE